MSQLQEYIEKHKGKTQRLLGLSYTQLHQLMAQAEKLHWQKRQESETKKIRLIKGGGGRQSKLNVQDQILLTLVYLHHYPTFQMLGVQFGVSESTAHNVFRYWLKILRELLPPSLLEQVKKTKSNGLGY